MATIGFTDIHTHILPHVDDGADSIRMTRDMVDIAYKEGVRSIIATPHYGIWNSEYNPENAFEIFKKIRGAVHNLHPDMNLYFGNEIFYQPGIVQSVIDGKARTLAGSSYVLIEFETSCVFDRIIQCVREFTLAGFKPILAHIERYDCINNSVDRVRYLVEIGAYIQVNSNSVMKWFAEHEDESKGLFILNSVRKGNNHNFNWLSELLNSELVHFIASDSHNTTTRKPMMKDPLLAIIDLIGKQKAYDICFFNGQKLIKNEYI